MKIIDEYEKTETGLKRVKEWRLTRWSERAIYVYGVISLIWAILYFLAIIAGGMQK